MTTARVALIAMLGRALAIALAAVATAAHAQQYAFRFLDQSAGLGNLSVTALAQDGEGYLWAGTENGLYRYDGNEFRRWGVRDAALRGITALQVDARGTVWAGSGRGLYRAEGDRLVPVLQGGAAIPVWPTENILARGDGHLLLVSRQSLLAVDRDPAGAWAVRPVFDAAHLAAHPELRKVTRVANAAGGGLWLGCDRFLCRVDGDRVVREAAPAADRRGWSGILEDRRGDLWLRDGRRILQRSRGAQAWVDRTPPLIDHGAELLSTPLLEDPQGRILTNSAIGLVRWDGRGWERIDAGSGLATPGGVAAALFDRDGGLWIGSAGTGVVQWGGYAHMVGWSARNGLADDDVWSILRDRAGRLHVGTATRVSVLAPDAVRFAPGAGPARSSPTSALAQDADGNLWSGDFGGTLAMTPAGSARRVVVAHLPMIFRLVVDSGGRLWICTQRGLFVVDPRSRDLKPRRVDETIDPPPEHEPRTFDGCDPGDGRPWFITDAGPLRWDGTRLVRIALQTASGARQAGSFELLACSGVKGEAWLGGGDNAGVWRLRLDGASDRGTIEPVLPPLLAQRNVVGLHQDRRGWLWVATDAGVAVWNRAAWRGLDEGSGLVWNDCNQYAMSEDADGSMWIGSSRGLSHVVAVDALFPPPPRRVVIAAVARGDEPLDIRTTSRLQWSRAPLNVTFASLAYEDRRADQFRYRLVGLDEQWVAGAGAQVSFSALPPGRYRLEAMASNETLGSASPVVAWSFEVDAPWWRTPLAYLAAAVAAIALAGWAHAWRLRLHTRRRVALETLVAERTRELEASREQMRMLALKDGLTEVWNRRALMDILQTEVAAAVRLGHPLTLVLVDADHFKRINDVHGHPAGDAVLRELARRLQAATRATDKVGRYGGEEFMVVMPALDPRREEDRRRVEFLQASFSQAPVVVDEQLEIAFTCSFGVACQHPSAPQDPASLIAQADAALYRAKEAGRNRVAYAP